MNSQIIGLRTASVLAGLIGLGHLIRLLMQLQVVVGTRQIPLWVSGVTVIVSVVVCWWLWKVSLPVKEETPVHHEMTTPAES